MLPKYLTFCITSFPCISSGMLHTGFDAIEPVELSCIQYTQRNIFTFLDHVGLPCKKLGATMVAWDSQQVIILDNMCRNFSVFKK